MTGGVVECFAGSSGKVPNRRVVTDASGDTALDSDHGVTRVRQVIAGRSLIVRTAGGVLGIGIEGVAADRVSEVVVPHPYAKILLSSLVHLLALEQSVLRSGVASRQP